MRSWPGATEADRKPLPHLSHPPLFSPAPLLSQPLRGRARVLPSEPSLVPDENGARGAHRGEGDGESGGGRAPGGRLRAPGKVAGGLGHSSGDRCRRARRQESKREESEG